MNPSEISQLLDDVKSRLDAAKIKYSDNSEFDENPSVDLIVEFPCGQQTRSIFIWDDDDLESFADIEFESYTLLGNFAAIANRKKGKIEAILTAPNEPKSGLRRQVLLKRLGMSEKNGVLSTVKLTPSEIEFPTVSISPISKTSKILTQSPDQLGASLTISTGASVTHDSALALLEQISNSLLFNIDVERAVHIALLRRSTSRRRPKAPVSVDALEYPKNDYDKPPMALYWYARSAESMPLLQYLAFYQVIEYYYPVYFNAEVGRRVRSIIKQPTFRVDRDLDVAKIVGVMKNKGQSVGGEREQLKATLKECLTNAEVEEFLAADSDRSSFFQSKAKGITSFLLNPQNRQVDLAMQVADRIYDIRCKIVHTKSDHDDGEIDLLLPYSPEAERLGHDIDLVRLIAQKVLIASSKRLEVAT